MHASIAGVVLTRTNSGSIAATRATKNTTTTAAVINFLDFMCIGPPNVTRSHAGPTREIETWPQTAVGWAQWF